jgi:glycosyltransferase involved in cell wall biosynthesis
VDTDHFSTAAGAGGARAALGLDADAPIVGTVSSLSEDRKGVAHFLEMAAAVARRVPSVQFVVAGDGALRPRLEAMARSLGLGQQVVFTGRLPDVRGVLAEMSVFVLPSLFEGCPYSLLEAMAMARPAVATAVGSVPEVVQDGVSGILVPPADPGALADAVCMLLRDETRAERMGLRGREIVTSRFAVSTMLDAILCVYRDAWNGRPARARPRRLQDAAPR